MIKGGHKMRRFYIGLMDIDGVEKIVCINDKYNIVAQAKYLDTFLKEIEFYLDMTRTDLSFIFIGTTIRFRVGSCIKTIQPTPLGYFEYLAISIDIINQQSSRKIIWSL